MVTRISFSFAPPPLRGKTIGMKHGTKTLGILGGGQLGRMSALAAARLGIAVHIYTPEENSPASQVSARTFVGSYDDKKKLREFAESVDVVSYEFENIPVDTIRFIQKITPVHPDDRLLEFRSLNWLSAQGAAGLAPLFRGATLILARKFYESRYF